ncbi:hypothetical protein [uncultured Veillonella sp.]|uniref:hypothetical protein n=1 Tax=uncultured Veillonella sp. TaxID=159268 RepID=UPI0025967A00|nr:hypothetical protein [uncultured Veillonella sp.]
MIDKILKKLTHTADKQNIPSKSSGKLQYTQQAIQKICDSLSIDNTSYEPSETISKINDYLNSNNKLERILYSEISKYFFDLDSSQKASFIANAEKLLHYSLDIYNKVNEDIKKLIVKIFDHIQLANYQNSNLASFVADNVEGIKRNILEQNKKIEREYISILGIFAAIILTFVGGITFSTSVLDNISSSNIFRLLLIIDFLAFILINTLYLLIKFILTINDKTIDFYNITTLNKICLGIIMVIVAVGMCDDLRRILTSIF